MPIRHKTQDIVYEKQIRPIYKAFLGELTGAVGRPSGVWTFSYDRGAV
jgi:hypothetical protein